MKVSDLQRDCCRYYDMAFKPPKPDHLVWISAGFYDPTQPVEGSRGALDFPLSGWVLTTPKHDGRPDSLVQVHFHHIVEKRPDLAVYMALPPGSSFLLGSQRDHVRFEELPPPENGLSKLA
ncbi:immunity protein Imm33 domain-containing protein [Aestuariispira insulae]|uniref:Imm33-like domain-containing protein n=1 Tax=Aestuariispira insulae TaxID=1461337 RepID=A0A3D9HGN4_9PROT|nr:hypothetical protein [Aestuariispira insulae]RED48575.1 hypothetical protein DFP90_10778 [Aestuariispira insulae]